MMNIIALWMVFSTLGAAHVLFPEHSPIVKEQQPLEGLKGAVKDPLHYADEAARQTGEGIRQTAAHIPQRAAEVLKHVGVDVAQAVKVGSQTGLEKIGLARPEKKPVFDVIKDEVDNAYQATKDAADESKEAAESAYEDTADCVKGSAETAKECASSYREKIKHVSEQAADIVRTRVAEAIAILPNVGQGLAYQSHDTNAGERIDIEGKEEGFRDKVDEYVKGLKHTAGTYQEGATQKASEAEETARQTKNAAVDGVRDKVDGVRDNAGKMFDTAKSSSQEVGHEVYDYTVDTRDNLTESIVDGELTLKNKTIMLYEKLKFESAAYFVSFCKAAHLFTFSSVYGSSLWVTFLSGYLLSRAMPRQQFGFVQSRIFPAYLRIAASGQAVCLVLFLTLHPWPQADRDEKLQQLDLWAILASTLANVFFFEPRATKAMFQKLKVEKEEGRGQDGLTGSEDDEIKARLARIENKFAVFHRYSSVANLLSLAGMTWHVWHLSHRLVA